MCDCVGLPPPNTGFNVMPISLEHSFMQCGAYYLIHTFLEFCGGTSNVQLFWGYSLVCLFGRVFLTCLFGISFLLPEQKGFTDGLERAA